MVKLGNSVMKHMVGKFKMNQFSSEAILWFFGDFCINSSGNSELCLQLLFTKQNILSYIFFWNFLKMEGMEDQVEEPTAAMLEPEVLINEDQPGIYTQQEEPQDEPENMVTWTLSEKLRRKCCYKGFM